jgi:4'-phosphopantetheinyl transferase
MALAGDFVVGALRCRWQAMPATVRAQDVAATWLRETAGDAVAAGLHRDGRGRPRLPAGDIGWSHSHGRLLVARADEGCVGVDVECCERQADAMRIARRYYTPGEIAALQAMADDARQRAFLRLWCAKEAVLKAHGGGIAFGLHRAEFDAGGEALRLLDCDPALGRASDWRLHETEPEPGFLAVLAWTPGILSP